MRAITACLAALVLIAPASAQAPQPEAEAGIRATLAEWYQLHRDAAKRPRDTFGTATNIVEAPGAVMGDPQPTVIERNPGSAAWTGYYVSNELAAKALEFRYDIDRLIIDGRFAKVNVWERGYFYAWAAQRTYENAASALFVMERQDQGQNAGRWLILAHAANNEGIPPNKITSPLPDLRALFYSTAGFGLGRDPEKDAADFKAGRF